MNERINKLAQQAGFEFDSRDCNFYHSDSAQYINNELRTFAELIVKETLEVARAGMEFGNGMEDAVYNYFEIKE